MTEICSCRTIGVSLSCLLALSAFADSDSNPDSLFQSDETLRVTITAPMTTLVEERPTEGYLNGSFQYENSAGSLETFDLKIRTRGHTRHANCDFPPLRLNFKKSQTKDTLFDKQNIMKLVVHCEKSDRYEQMVLREYLAYKILNAITELSFRVRLLQVTYIDSDNRRKDQHRYAYLIEHKKRLAKRFDMQNVIVDETTISAMEAGELNLTSIFEFFLGNTDFSPIAGPPDSNCCHNYVLFQWDLDPLIAIPYDFDQSGFVNATYARPNPRFRLRSVRQRLYRGRCVNNDYIDASLQVFRERRDIIYALIKDQEGLSNGSRKYLLRYIDQFYKLISNPDDLQDKIIGRCI
jgi:hypothetical protein